MLKLEIGYQGPLYNHWYNWAQRYASSYSFMLGARDGYYGEDEAAFTAEMQRRLGIVQDGVFGDRTAAAVGYAWPGDTSPPKVETRRPIWFYSCPGSGADWWLGPSYDVGQMVAGTAWNEPGRRSLRINHQPVHFQKGGYLGLLGGDPKYSYLEVIADQLASLRWLLRNNPDVQRALDLRALDRNAEVDVELWFSGYSQSADGLVRAIERLFGIGGEFESIRDRVNGVICFGNPATPETGIARLTMPDWVNRLVINVNTADDFYAVARDDIRPAFYAEVVKAEMELPFFVHVLRIAIPIVLEWASAILPLFRPLLGGSPFGPMVQLALPMIQGLGQLSRNSPALGTLMGMAGGGRDVDTTTHVQDILSPTGVLSNIPDLIHLIGSLPGLVSHGEYHATCDPRPEFGNRTGTQLAYDHVAGFRR